jgi:hypothetical protein
LDNQLHSWKSIWHAFRFFPRIWRLRLHVRGFRTVSSARVAVHYPPELEQPLDLCLPVTLHRYDAELVELTQQFGIELPAPVSVFLLRNRRDIRKLFRMDAAGLALISDNAIALAADWNDQEMIRHEFGHLFSAVWNPSAPRLLSEGRSVWLQRTQGGQPIESAGKDAMYDESLTLNRLFAVPSLFLDRGFRRNSCYSLAGCFTGFLIRHYGWNRYRQFYTSAGAADIQEIFQEHFGLSLEAAEDWWRQETIAEWA